MKVIPIADGQGYDLEDISGDADCTTGILYVLMYSKPEIL